MKAKYAKLVVKDASGNIIQLLPETKVDTVYDPASTYPVSGQAIASVVSSIGEGFVQTTGNETISGQKTFAQGPYQTAVALSGTAIDLSQGSVFTKTISANTTFTITNAPSGKAASFKLALTNGGAYTITWPASVSWSSGYEPELKTSGIDLLTFNTWDGGTSWRGSSDVISFETPKEIAILSAEPTAQNTSAIDNEGLVFWSEGTTAGQAAGSPVLLSGNQTIEGQKKFLGGLYGGAYTMGSSEWAIDLTKATCFTKTVTASGTFSFTNVPEATACCITLILVNGGNYTVHWPASVKWSENETPTLTQNGTDVFTFVTCTGGNVWYGTTTCIGVTA
jgi:hypothetical protein